jgi:sterol desaturase/sphingolipid hydroxylase (fatty acid hydroxylase superfamily)
MLSELVTIIHSIGMTVVQLLPFLLAFGAVFAVLSYFWPCNSGRPWWRNRGLMTDLGYWFFIPLVARYFRIGLLILGAAWLFGIHTTEGLAEFYADGHGPLAQLPLWAQALVFLVGTDIMMYWMHRGFHRPTLWRFHAVHHSSEDLDWISAMRFHPINIFLGSVLADVVMLLAGVSPQVLVFLGPFNIAHSVFVHANLKWTLGPFKYVIAGPVFHRWHHTSVERGGEKNFAPTLPVLDLLFGTFYMPKDEVPDAYGVAEPMPMSFADQLLYPFKR